MTRTRRCACVFTGIFAVTFHSAAAAQTACPSNDAPCIVGQAVYDAVIASHQQDGVIQFAVGTYCADAALRNQGQARYAGTLGQVTTTAKNAILQSGLNAGVAQPYLQSLPAMVKIARSTEVSGVIAGLRSAFAMYPGTRTEYCARMRAAVGR